MVIGCGSSSYSFSLDYSWAVICFGYGMTICFLLFDHRPFPWVNLSSRK
jgi:hypothetical protein